jgi:hypothetical protein
MTFEEALELYKKTLVSEQKIAQMVAQDKQRWAECDKKHRIYLENIQRRTQNDDGKGPGTF